MHKRIGKTTNCFHSPIRYNISSGARKNIAEFSFTHHLRYTFGTGCGTGSRLLPVQLFQFKPIPDLFRVVGEGIWKSRGEQ